MEEIAAEAKKESPGKTGAKEQDGLVDIREVKIDASLPAEERMRSFLHQIRDPCLFRYKDMIVEAVFMENGDTLTDRLKQAERFLASEGWTEGEEAYDG